MKHTTKKELIFLGDSITDCGHLFEPNNIGNGYVKIIQDTLAQRGIFSPILNYGYDGFTTKRMIQTWKRNRSSCNPALISILIGVNDISVIEETAQNKEQALRLVILEMEHFISALTCEYDIPILWMEPFLFPCPSFLSNWMDTRQILSDAFARIAKENNIPYLKLHHPLNQIAKECGYDAITIDGVHLTELGHQFLAKKCLEELNYCSFVNVGHERTVI